MPSPTLPWRPQRLWGGRLGMNYPLQQLWRRRRSPAQQIWACPWGRSPGSGAASVSSSLPLARWEPSRKRVGWEQGADSWSPGSHENLPESLGWSQKDAPGGSLPLGLSSSSSLMPATPLYQTDSLPGPPPPPPAFPLPLDLWEALPLPLVSRKRAPSARWAHTLAGG